MKFNVFYKVKLVTPSKLPSQYVTAFEVNINIPTN